MLQVEEALKDLYRSDSTDKNLILEFYHPGEEEPFLSIWESGYLMGESMEIEESLSSSDNLDFGSCEASQLKITLIDVNEDIQNAEMAVYQTLEGQYPAMELFPGEDVHPSGYVMPLGRYVVQSAKLQANRRYRDVVALDYMCRFDVDVTSWYNALAFPLTLKEFRASLCRRIGVVESVPDYLPNDGILITKTVEATELMGREVLIACEQANGVFGHFDRRGVLQHITLQTNYNLLPAPDLYPSEDLFPILPGEMNTQVSDEDIKQNLLISCQYEDYTVQSIEKVQIRQEEGDIGAIYGDGTNCLTVEGNFLLFGKLAAELHQIAFGIYGMVSGRKYIPYEAELKGLPYIEVGDSERLEFGEDSLISYVIRRTLIGVYALRDQHRAEGDEYRRTEKNVNTEIIQLKGKAAVLKRNVDEVSSNLIDFEKETETKFMQTAEQISLEAKRAQEAEASLKIMADNITLSVKDLKSNMESQFIQTAQQISLKVSKGQVSSQLSIEPDDITIRSNRFSWEATNSTMTKDGTLNCRNIRATNGYFSGELDTGVLYADDDIVQFGDFYVSADGSNVLQSNDGSIVFQTEQGGPFGRYPALSIGDALITENVIRINQVEAASRLIVDGVDVLLKLKKLERRIEELES